MAQKEWVNPESKFCRWCQKRFANEAVFNGHLTGKKHIKALEAGGRKGEADLIRRKIQEAKAREASKKAQAEAAENTKKRKKNEKKSVNFKPILTLLRIISGARYSGVPQRVHVRPLTRFAKPKSVICKKKVD